MEKLLLASILAAILLAGCVETACNFQMNLEYPKRVNSIIAHGKKLVNFNMNLMIDNTKGNGFTISQVLTEPSFDLKTTKECESGNESCVIYIDIKDKKIEAGENVTIPIIATLTDNATINQGFLKFNLTLDIKECNEKTIGGTVTINNP
jgi:hypothetical protein